MIRNKVKINVLSHSSECCSITWHGTCKAFYFVPYHLLWRPFKQLINPVPDVNSALSTASEKNNSVSGVPYFTAKQLVTLFENNNVDDGNTFMGFPRKPYLARLLDMLSYYSDNTHAYQNAVTGADGTYTGHLLSSFTDEWKFNPFRILAFNRILSDFYRATDYVQSVPQKFNIDDLDSGTQIPDERLRAIFHVFKATDALANQPYACFPFAKWHLDRLISVKPTQLYGSFNNPTNVNSSSSADFYFDNTTGGVTTKYVSSTNALIDNQDLRVSHALEKIARVSMSAPKTFPRTTSCSIW